MNDTIINNRQKQILEFVREKGALSRLELSEMLSGTNQVSKITVIRDLNSLLDLGLLSVSGEGRGTKYFLCERHPLLKFFNVSEYFKKSPDVRSVKYSSFNSGVFLELKGLFSRKELKEFDIASKHFQKQLDNKDRTIVKRELERFVIDLSWKSSQIEGNTYSLLETEELIKNQKEAKGHPREEATMILNHKAAFDMILENRESFKKLSLTDIQSVHAILTKDLSIDQGLRKKPVGITGTVYIPLGYQSQISEVMRKTILVVNELSHPMEKALVLLSLISYIQPFADGNKRTARMVSNASLLAFGFYPLSYRGIDEVEFKKALILFYEQNSLYYLKQLFLEQARFARNNYFR